MMAMRLHVLPARTNAKKMGEWKVVCVSAMRRATRPLLGSEARRDYQGYGQACAHDRTPRQPAWQCSLLAGKPADSPLEKVRVLKGDCRGDRRRITIGQSQDCRSKDQRGPGASGVVSFYFRLISDVV